MSRDSTRLRFTGHAIRNFIAFHSDVSRWSNRLIDDRAKKQARRFPVKFRPTHFEIIDITEGDFSSRQLFRVRLIDHPGIEVLNQIHLLSREKGRERNLLFSSFSLSLFFTLSFSLDETDEWPTVENFRAIFFSFSLLLSLVCCINGEVVQILRLKRLVSNRREKFTIENRS